MADDEYDYDADDGDGVGAEDVPILSDDGDALVPVMRFMMMLWMTVFISCSMIMTMLS